MGIDKKRMKMRWILLAVVPWVLLSYAVLRMPRDEVIDMYTAFGYFPLPWPTRAVISVWRPVLPPLCIAAIIAVAVAFPMKRRILFHLSLWLGMIIVMFAITALLLPLLFDGPMITLPQESGP